MRETAVYRRESGAIWTGLYEVMISPRLIKRKVVKMYCGVKVSFHAFLTFVLEVIGKLHAPVVLSQHKEPPAKGLGGFQSQSGGRN